MSPLLDCASEWFPRTRGDRPFVRNQYIEMLKVPPHARG